MPNSFDRLNAISIELPPKDGRIERFFSVNDRLLVITENSIVELFTAEQIDKESNHLETRHHYQKLYSIGASNLLIINTLLFADNYLQKRIFQENFDQAKCKNHIWICMEYLLKCESSLFKIYSSILQLRPICDKLIQESKKNTVIPSLPQVEGLEDLVGNFLGNGKKFIEKTYEFLCLFVNCPQFGSKFKKYQKWLQTKGNYSTLLSVVDDFIEETQFIANLRNAHSLNHPRAGQSVEIKNFTMRPSNKFSEPSWRYDLSGYDGKTQIEYTNLFLDFETFLHNMGIFFPSIFTECIKQVDITDEILKDIKKVDSTHSK